MILFAGCKINLGLDILSRRPDGYHNLESVMVPVRGLCDMLEIVPSDTGEAVFTSSGLMLDCPPESNICLKAYRLMAGKYKIGGVRMHLHKKIPFGAGLGGGSSDATHTIKGLDSIFGLQLTGGEMESLAAGLGSDTPFFVKNEIRLMSGRGDMLSQIDMPQLDGKVLMIVKPDINVSTAEAYSGIVPSIPERPLSERLAADPGTWKDTVSNAFEEHIFMKYPVLAEIKEALYEAGAIYACMSGSGSAMFGIFDASNVEADACSLPGTAEVLPAVSESLRARFGELFIYQEVMRTEETLGG